MDAHDPLRSPTDTDLKLQNLTPSYILKSIRPVESICMAFQEEPALTILRRVECFQAFEVTCLMRVHLFYLARSPDLKRLYVLY